MIKIIAVAKVVEQGLAGQKGTFFLFALKNIFKHNFFEQKNLGDRIFLNITLKFYFCVFENISILN